MSTAPIPEPADVVDPTGRRHRLALTPSGHAALFARALHALHAGEVRRRTGRAALIEACADRGIYKVTGSLVGDWTITAFNTTATSPLLEAKGSEQFTGCLDLRRNGCDRRDPKGTLSFTFTYQALFASPDPASLVWGSCRHPIVSGTGGLAGATGVIAMVDTPSRGEVRTDYLGNLTLPGQRRSAGRHMARAAGVASPADCA
jgi:hypothetical protein